MNKISSKALEELSNRLEPSQLKIDAATRTAYGTDWSHATEQSPCAVAFPECVEAVQIIVAWAKEFEVPLVPSGGRTGYSGGADAGEGELVVSLDKLNEISAFNPIDKTVVCGAGVITAALQEFALGHGLLYPVDFASSGSSQIGGNIATNAGGIRVIRYGMTREWVTGLKVVNAEGELLHLNRGLAKNNAGYDLRHLFVGSEGTLGIIVEATMRLCEPPPPTNVLLVGASDLLAVLKVLDTFQTKLRLQAFEFFSDSGLQRVINNLALPQPLKQSCPYYALIEAECPTAEAQDTVMACFEHCSKAGWVTDGIVASTQKQAQALWRYREQISATIAVKRPYKQDISATVSQMPDLLGELQELINTDYAGFESVWFGHIGDGNIHLNLLAPDSMSSADFAHHCRDLSQAVFSAVQKFGGSVSAEHGVGLLKKPYLTYSHKPEELRMMAALKQSLDPLGIMNPGKILDV